MLTSHPFLRRAFGLALLLILSPSPGALRAGDDALTLRVNDTTAEPGGVAAVVLRTYASRGVGQGQIVVKSRRPARRGLAASDPFVELEQVMVFSDMDDVAPVDSFNTAGQTAQVEFESLSASINLTDGPFAAFIFRLAPDLAPGSEFELTLDVEGTFLLDGLGLDVPIEPRAGTLRVGAPGPPYQLAAEGDNVLPGEVAALAVETSQIFGVRSGQVGFRYEPAFAAGPPVVSMDPRYGKSSFIDVDLSTPGLVVASFVADVGSLVNLIPGQIISIDLPTSAAMPSGSRSPLSLDPALTYLENPQGFEIPLTFAGDELVLGGDAIFADGFESGDTSRW